jgi:hypothetical protein
VTGPAGALRVAVAWLGVDGQDVVTLELPAGASAGDAIERSGLLAAWGIAAAGVVAAIRGRPVAHSAPVGDGDRVDLTRPLVADPKEIRRRRAVERPLPRPRPRQKRTPSP